MEPQKTIASSRAFLLGTTVVALYIIFVSAVFAGFASYIYRSEWQAALSEDKGKLNLEDLFFTIRREKTLSMDMASDRAELLKLDATISEMESQRDVAFGELAVIKDERAKLAFHELAKIRNVIVDLPVDKQQQMKKILDDTLLSVVERADQGLLILQSVKQSNAKQQMDGLHGLMVAMQEARTTLNSRKKSHSEKAH